MKKALEILARVFISSIAIVSLIETFLFARTHTPLLLSPYGLALLPFQSGQESMSFFQTFPSVAIAKMQSEWVYAISPLLASSLVYLLISIFIRFFIQKSRMEKAYLYFAWFFQATIFMLLDYGSLNYLGNMLFIAIAGVNASYYYLYRSLLNRRTRGIYPVVFFLAAFVFLIFWKPESIADERLVFYVLGGISFFNALLHLYFLLREVFRRQSQMRKSLLWGNVVAFLSLGGMGLLFPLVLVFKVPLYLVLNTVFFLPSVFPMVFLILSTRYGIARYKVPVYGSLIQFWYFLFFTLTYWVVAGYFLVRGQSHGNNLINFLAMAAFLLIVEPIRSYFFSYIERMFQRRRVSLERYLRLLNRNINNPVEVMDFLERLSGNLQEALGVSRVRLIIADGLLPEWVVKRTDSVVVRNDHPLWEYVQKKTSGENYRQFNETHVGPVRDLLRDHGGSFLVGLRHFSVAITISGKESREPILSEDIRFLMIVARSLENIIQYYVLLVSNVQLRKQEKELELVSRIQKKMIPTEREYPQLKYFAMFTAQDKVTGDYLDFLNAGMDRYFAFLGDVSGHGLRSAYIMSLVRAFLRGSLLHGSSNLSSAFRQLNLFLNARYGRANFITLFGFDIRLQDNGVELRYINAGHHPAILYYKESGRLRQLRKSMPVLGVLPVDYEETVLFIDEPFRIYVYTDGAFEIFDEAGKMLGRNRLIRIVRESLNAPLKESLTEIRQKISSIVGSPVEMDDLALLGVEIIP